MARFQLPYNTKVLDIDLPDSANVKTLSPGALAPLEDPHADLISNLESPSEGPGLDAMLQTLDGFVLIIVQDHTRVSGKEKALTWIIDHLESKGISPEKVKVLVALGSHKPASEELLKKTIGDSYSRVEVIQHDPGGDLTDYGTTSLGTNVKVNSLFTRAGLVILYTSVVHHYFAGFGGGRKIILPGISSLDTISANHSLVFHGVKSGGGRHPLVKSGNLDGNPVAEDMLEAAKLVLDGKKYMEIAVAMTPSKEIAYITAGEIDSAHRRACSFVESQNTVKIDRLADVVIASAGGFPKDTNVIQSHKGLDNAVHALKPGGTMLYLMSCSAGVGNPAITRFSPLKKDEIRLELEKDYIVYGQTVYAMKEKAEKYRVLVMSDLDSGFWADIGYETVESPGSALEILSPTIEKSNLIYHIPRADLVIPRATT